MFNSGSPDITSRINFVEGTTSGFAAFDRAENDVESLRKSLDNSSKASDKLNNDLKRVAGGGADLGRASGGIERVANAIGAQLGGSLLGLAGDVSDVVSALGSEGGGLRGILSSLVSPAGAVAVGIAAATVAISAFTAELERQRQAAQETIAQLQTSARTQAEYVQILESSGTEALENIKAQQAAQLDLLAAESEVLFAQREELRLAQEAQRARGEINLRTDNLLAEADKAYAELNERVQTLDQSMQDLSTVMSSAAFEVQKTSEATESVFTKRLQNLVDAQKDAGDSAEEAENRLSRLAGVLDKTAASTEKAAAAAQQAAEEFANLQGAAQSAVDKLNEDRGALSAALRDTLAGLNQEIVDAQNEAAADILAAQQQAAANALKATNEFNKQEDRAHKDYRNEQARIRREAQRSERAAIEQNDIAQLLAIRESASEAKRDNRDRYKEERDRRREDFKDRQEVEARALEERINNINTERDQAVAAAQVRIDAERAATDAAIAEIDRLKAAEIERVRAAVTANNELAAAQARAAAGTTAAFDATANRLEALVLYMNGQLYQLTPGLRNSPPLPGSAPPTSLPFGLDQFPGAYGGLPPVSPGTYTPPLPLPPRANGAPTIVIQGMQVGEIVTPNQLLMVEEKIVGGVTRGLRMAAQGQRPV